MKFLTVLLILMILVSSQMSYACDFVPSLDYAKKVVDEAYFIGEVKITSREDFASGNYKNAHLQPVKVYKSLDGLDLNTPIMIEGNDFGSSCDVELMDVGMIQEVVIMRQENGPVLGSMMAFELMDLWDELRKNAVSIGVE